MNWLMFLLTMAVLIVMAVVPPHDLEPHQKVKLAIYFFLFGLIGFLIGRSKLMKHP